MDAAFNDDLMGQFSRILRALGENDAFFTVALALSQAEAIEIQGEEDGEPTIIDRGQLTERLASFLTQKKYDSLLAWLQDWNFVAAISQLADKNQTHADGNPAEGDQPPSYHVNYLLADDKLSALLPRLTDENDLKDLLIKLGENDNLKGIVHRLALQPDDNLTRAVDFLAANGDVARFLTDAGAQQIVKQMATNGLYRAAQKLSHAPLLTERLADNATTFFASSDGLAAHPELDRLLERILTEYETNDTRGKLASHDAFIDLVINLAGSITAQRLARRILDDEDYRQLADKLNEPDFYRLVAGFALEPKSQELAGDILFTTGFPETAAALSKDKDLTGIVERMQKGDLQNVTEMLKSTDDAKLLINVAEKPDYTNVVKRMREDEAKPTGFNDLVKQLRENSVFLGQIRRLSQDKMLAEFHDAFTTRSLSADKLARRMSELGDLLYKNKEQDEAVNAYALSLRLDPTSREARLGHARACMACNLIAQAIQDYLDLLGKNDQDTQVYLELGDAYRTTDFLDKAKECYYKVLKFSLDSDERNHADLGLLEIAHKESL